MTNTNDDVDVTYDFDVLVERIYQMIDDQKVEKKVYHIPPPKIDKLGGRKCIFTNSKEICNKINRENSHLFKFICSELVVEGSINQEQQIILKGKYTSKNMKKILASYINKYVMCSICKCLETKIVVEQSITYLECATCIAKNSIIDPIK